MCILSVYTLLKVVNYYNLGVLTMSVIGFQKNEEVWMWSGWVGRAPPKFILDFWNFLRHGNTYWVKWMLQVWTRELDSKRARYSYTMNIQRSVNCYGSKAYPTRHANTEWQ